jgi:hypothetical protein
VSSVSGFDYSVYFPTAGVSCSFATGTTSVDGGTPFAVFHGSYARSTGSDSLALYVPLLQAVGQTISWQTLVSMGLPLQADLKIGGQLCSGTPIAVPDGSVTPTGAAAYTGTMTFNSAGPAWSVTLNLTCPTDSSLNIVGTFSGNP